MKPDPRDTESYFGWISSLSDSEYWAGAPSNPKRDEPLPARVVPPRGVWIGTFEELEALDLPEPQQIGNIGGLPIYEGETLLVYGPSNVGKSLLAMRLLVEAAIEGHPVLLVEGEGSQRNLRERIRRLAKGLRPEGIGDARGLLTIAHGAFGLAEHLDTWRALIEEKKPKIVMLDPMVSYFSGDENAAREVQSFLEHVSLARAHGAAVIVVHHSTKPNADGKSSARGSGALRAWCDEAIAVGQGSKQNEVLIVHDKSREHAKQEPQRVEWEYSNDFISMRAEVTADGAVESAAQKRREITLLGILASEGQLTVSEARKRCGNLNSEKFRGFLQSLIRDGKVHTLESDDVHAGRNVTYVRPGVVPEQDGSK